VDAVAESVEGETTRAPSELDLRAGRSLTPRRLAAGGAPGRSKIAAHPIDASGEYPPAPAGTLDAAATRHGRLRGFVVTGTDGAYLFATIRPGSYPGRTTPQHVHMHVVEPGCHYYIDDVIFRDDPKLTPAEEAMHARGRGGSGIVAPMRAPDGGWLARRYVVLGAGITDHARCDARGRGEVATPR